MTPYYDEAGITIYHGDCREVLPGIGGADLVVTDPPYGIGFVSTYRKVRHAPIAGDDALPLDVIRGLSASASSAAYIFCRWDSLDVMPRPKSVLVWVKNNWSMGDLKHEHGRQWEAICFYPGPEHAFLRRIPDVLQMPRVSSDRHPTEKPVPLMCALIEANVGRVVLDPYMGCGTTLRAAKDAGRRAVGIEIEERYCEMAAKRCAQEAFSFSSE